MSPALGTTRVDLETDKALPTPPDENWGFKWDYDGLYDPNIYNTDGEKSAPGLSTESPFYFMELYNQDRSNDGSKRPQSNLQPDFSNQLPNPFDYLDRGMSNQPTTTQSSLLFPLEPPKLFHTPTDAPQQPVNAAAQQRTFLLTTLLPICIIIVLLLIAALAIIWYLKCRGNGGSFFGGRKAQRRSGSDFGGNGGNGEDANAQERVPLKEDARSLGKKNGVAMTNNNDSQVGNKTPKKSLGHLKDRDSVLSQPSKPLILPNEKPPLIPPDLPGPMTKGAADPPPFPPRVAAATGTATTTASLAGQRHFYAMGQRPDPYRNPPPPIDTRFGLPRQMVPQYGLYRRDPAV